MRQNGLDDKVTLNAQVSARFLLAHSQAPLALTSLDSKLEANMTEEEMK
jgi:hypothetical protein